MRKAQLINSGKFTLILISSVFLVFFIVLYAPSRLATEFDDAYMYSRYSSNYLAGNGFSWNVSDGPAYGATSPMYLFIITLVKGVFPGVTNSFLLSLVSLCMGILGLIVLISSGFKEGKNLTKFRLPLLVIPICILSASFRYHLFTGMETTLSFFSNSLLVLSLVGYGKRQSNLSLAFILFASIFTILVRPDNGIYALSLPVIYLLSISKTSTKKVVIYCSSFLCLIASLLFIYKLLFGSALPIPFYAKSGDFFIGYAGRGTWNSIAFLFRFLRDVFPFIVVLVLLTRKSKLRVVFSILTPVVITFIYFSTALQIMGWFARYYFPSIPFFILASYIVTEDQLISDYKFLKKYLMQRGFILLLISLPLYLTPLRYEIENSWSKYVSETQLYSPEVSCDSPNHFILETIPWWDSIQCISTIVGSFPPGAKIAATEYGYIASENLHIDVVDMAGLHNSELVLSGFSSEHILSQHPDFIWMPHTDYTYFRKCILDNSDFQALYHFYPEVFNYGIALRLSSSFYQDMLLVTDSVFCSTYSDMELSDFLASLP